MMRVTGFLAGVGLTIAAFMQVLRDTCSRTTGMRADNNSIDQWPSRLDRLIATNSDQAVRKRGVHHD